MILNPVGLISTLLVFVKDLGRPIHSNTFPEKNTRMNLIQSATLPMTKVIARERLRTVAILNVSSSSDSTLQIGDVLGVHRRAKETLVWTV